MPFFPWDFGQIYVNYQISYLVNPSTLVLVNFFGVVDFEWRQHVRHAWTDVTFFLVNKGIKFFLNTTYDMLTRVGSGIL